ncbi:MAG: 3-hydroxy-3-methylglutaryl CoA synthase [Deltaproteobacteria bacterium]|nr:3-hydroxy-3-methylglutaryl CoA synthase [Deltaproteobacteria bacterium]
MNRLSLSAISGGGRKAGSAGGERAIAYFDEDAVTMAVAASTNCLEGFDRRIVDGVLFASTSYPYKEKQAASVVAKALDLRRDVVTADFADSVRCGTNALRSAIDAVKAGSARNVLIVATDCRPTAPRSALEKSFGDGAAAFLVSDTDVAATIEHHHVIADEIIDVWRTESDRFVRSWEDRFVVEHGYTHNTIEAIKGLLAKSGLAAKDFAKAVLYSPDGRSFAAVARAIGLDAKTQVQDPMFGRLGNTGAAFAPMLLAAALEEAKPGSKLLLANYGDGAEASVVQVTDAATALRNKRGIAWHMQRRTEFADYDKFLNFRNLQVSDVDRRGGQGVSATVHFRDRNEDISFHGHKCRRCGTEQFPLQRVCFKCFARDDFDEVRLSDRIGKVMSFTFDFFAGSPDPPLVVTTAEVEGGARVYVQMTDVSPKEVKLDLPVEFTFRKIHEYGGTPNYFWKCTPAR